MASPVPAPILRAIGWLWCAVIVVYVAYGWYAYACLYRMLAEWQLSVFGGYRVFLTALLPAIALALPGLWLAGLGQRGAATASPANPRRSLLLVTAIGVAGLAVAAAAVVLGLQEARRVPVVATLDLRQSATLPDADVFVVIGLARTDLMLAFATETRGAKRDYAYVPLTTPQWRRGEPLVYFLKTNQNAYTPPEDGRMFRLVPSEAPFLMTLQRAVVETHALPGPVREIYRTHNVALAPELHVFSQNVSVALDHYWITAAIAGLSGLVCLLAAGITVLRLRRGA